MQKRQTILLILMGLALVYAAYTLLSGGAAEPPSRTTAKDFAELLDGVDKASVQNALTLVEKHRLAVLNGESGVDPMLKRDPVPEGTDVATRTGDERFIYSGFLSIGETKMALINNSEYSEGDLVDETGYTLLTIRSDTVVLQGRAAESGQEEKVAIPIQEDIITFVEDKK